MRVFLLSIMSGWIKIYKQFKDWEWYNKSEMVHLFIHCLLKANFKDGSFQGITVEKGSFITSLKHLSEETNISIQTIRTCLKKLQLTKEINVKSTSKLTKITICKYEGYQVDDVQANKQVTNKQQTTNKQLTTIEEEKEYKEEKEYSNIESIDFDVLLKFINDSFDRKVKLINYKAKKQFKARLKNGYTKEDIKQCILNLKSNTYHKENGYQYCTPEFISRQDTLDKYSSLKQQKENLSLEQQILKNYKG